MKPYALSPEQGDAIWMFNALDTIKADAIRTGGSFSVIELLDFEGSAVPLHVSDRWDRGFYVLEGEYRFVIGNDSLLASAGTWVFAPRNTAHAWRCLSARGRLLNVRVPGGFEDFYRQVGSRVTDRTQLPPRSAPDAQALSGAAAQFGITFVGPAPAAA